VLVAAFSFGWTMAYERLHKRERELAGMRANAQRDAEYVTKLLPHLARVGTPENPLALRVISHHQSTGGIDSGLADALQLVIKEALDEGVRDAAEAVVPPFDLSASDLKVAQPLKLRPHLDPLRLVHVKEHRSSAADGCLACNEGSVDPKVLLPTVGPWVEQSDAPIRSGIHAREVRPLVGVAVRASQGEVVEPVRATVLLGAYVLDVEPQEGRRQLRQAAVLRRSRTCRRVAASMRDAYLRARLASARALACRMVMKWKADR
jgi:hypothetical protein